MQKVDYYDWYVINLLLNCLIWLKGLLQPACFVNRSFCGLFVVAILMIHEHGSKQRDGTYKIWRLKRPLWYIKFQAALPHASSELCQFPLRTFILLRLLIIISLQFTLGGIQPCNLFLSFVQLAFQMLHTLVYFVHLKTHKFITSFALILGSQIDDKRFSEIVLRFLWCFKIFAVEILRDFQDYFQILSRFCKIIRDFALLDDLKFPRFSKTSRGYFMNSYKLLKKVYGVFFIIKDFGLSRFNRFLKVSEICKVFRNFLVFSSGVHEFSKWFSIGLPVNFYQVLLSRSELTASTNDPHFWSESWSMITEDRS